MMACLSDRALMRLGAELATAAERDHLATCARCCARQRRIMSEIGLIRQVLISTPEPRPVEREASRRWRPAWAALSAVVMVGALFWLELTVWRQITSDEEGSRQPVADVLNDVSSALLSEDGDPISADVQSVLVTLGERNRADDLCDDGDEGGMCSDAAPELARAEDAIETLAIEDDGFEPEHVRQGERS